MRQTRARLPFIFGSQYYRAPTPEPECWEHDLRRMRELGFNTVKLFVQWRWSHRGEDRFTFDDLDGLMDLAAQNGLAANLNTLLDMSPTWLFRKHPAARQVSAAGEVIEPYAVGHRSIGGHPGPCYRHPGALEERKRFMAATVDHFRGHPALWTWDVWNEPEQSFPSRVPNLRTLVCYCPVCVADFAGWLRAKYGDLEHLNQVWGRCYGAWEEVEPSRDGGTITDFVDWREFHLDTMTDEAAWRLDLVREHDPKHPAYLHVVPNTMAGFCAVTCVDDFALAEHCDLFAASMNSAPGNIAQVVSAGRGRVCYNVESHVNYGSVGMHQRRLGLEQVLPDFVPQIGMGVKGFLFWQYRAEVLGAESPAWGLVKPDGTDRPVTAAVETFWSTLAPHAEALMEAQPPTPEVGIWKSRKNELFHFAAHGSLQSLSESVEGYVQALYWSSIPFRFVSEAMLERGELEGLKLLVMPSCYYLTEGEARALDEWVKQGGVLLNEAHLGGYNGTTGRHSRVIPGCGLAESWGLREADSTSSYHLHLVEQPTWADSATEEVRATLRDLRTSGARFFPVRLADGTFAWGANRYAVLEGDDLAVEASFNGVDAVVVSKRVGSGRVLYAGTNLGEGAGRGSGGVSALLAKCCSWAGIKPTLGASAEVAGTVHVDTLGHGSEPRFVAVTTRADGEQTLHLTGAGEWRGLFSGEEWSLGGAAAVRVPARLADIFVLKG